MNKRIITYFLIGIATSLVSVTTVFAQQHQHGEQHNSFRSPYVEQLDSPVRGLRKTKKLNKIRFLR